MTKADNGTYNYLESAIWSGVSATTLLSQMATDSSHFFDNPPSSQLAAVFTQAARSCSHTAACT